MNKQYDLIAKIEPFDTFWEAPDNIEKGYDSFGKFYKRNYLKFLPENKSVEILVISCGAGYFVNLLNKEGFANVIGIDSDPEKIEYAKSRALNCHIEHAFPFLEEKRKTYDVIFAEQEINHLSKNEIVKFLEFCWDNLTESGTLIIHSLNGANPITGSEALSQNFDHYNTFTEYSMIQVLKNTGFENIKVIPLKLFVFYKNPINYIGILLDWVLSLSFRLAFIFYGKANKIFSKKIAAIAQKR